jgi:hypothetical protein
LETGQPWFPAIEYNFREIDLEIVPTANVLVIEYWVLRFICNLVLVICLFDF